MKTTQEANTERMSVKAKRINKMREEDQVLLFPEKLAWVNEMLKTAKLPSGEYLIPQEEREN